MNASRCIHSVTGERLASSVSSGARNRTWAATNSGSAMSVLVEGLTSKQAQKANLLNIKQAQYTCSWMDGTDIQEGDRLTYSGKKYAVHEVVDDSTRPSGKYWTAILARVVETT